MSLASWFKQASAIKKTAVVTLAAINALTLTNSAMVGHKIVGDGLEAGPYQSVAANILMAPLWTSAQWTLSKFDKESQTGPTPLTFVANQTKKVIPAKADFALSVFVSAVGAPGAWIGYGAGAATGYMTRDKSNTPTPQ